MRCAGGSPYRLLLCSGRYPPWASTLGEPAHACGEQEKSAPGGVVLPGASERPGEPGRPDRGDGREGDTVKTMPSGMLLVKQTIFGCWGCGRPWPALVYEPLVFAPTLMGYYCAHCDVYSQPGVPPEEGSEAPAARGAGGSGPQDGR